jgi:glutamate-1-semialdehyde 2,1-aminomutase
MSSRTGDRVRNGAPAGARTIEEAYRARTPGSAKRARQAAELLPSGVTHDSRHLLPHSVYVERAKGARKWDVDGHAYVDYFGGHGSLLLGHGHPRVTAAIEEALGRGTHFAANHDAELRWARHVVDMVPSAEKVRFTSSGTEAVALAVRLARAHTGRSRLLRFRGQFHGWSDDQVAGYASHFDGGAPAGVPSGVASNAVLLEAGDVDALRETLRSGADIAAVLVEPLGAATGMVPISKSFLEALRELTAAHGQVLIFDEVITGFRVSPGGVQAAYGITPDLTALAKILAGGLPGGAVAGRPDLLDWLDHAASRRQGREKIYHPGTYNANPVCAAAGAAALSVIAEGGVCEAASEAGRKLRENLTDAAAKAGAPWGVYGRFSAVHICMNPELPNVNPLAFSPKAFSRQELQAKPPELLRRFRLAMLVNGVDLSGWPGGLLSVAHTDEDIAFTVEAFRTSLSMLRREGMI